MTNAYCDVLGVDVPVLEAVAGHAEANTFSLLIVALLERGAPMTLREVAERFARAGIAPADEALVSLSRCRPARSPVYRDGERYALDPRDDETDLWAFRLGLRSPRARVPRMERPEIPPLPGPDVRLTVPELEEAWNEERFYSWSAQRVAACVLDAHGRPMAPEEIAAFLRERAKASDHLITRREARSWPRGASVRVLEDGRWALVPGHPWVASARQAVRDRLALLRRWAALRPDPVKIEENRRAFEERRAAHAAELARLRRALVHAFPRAAPQWVVVVDVAARQLTTFGPDELARVPERLAAFDVVAALDVRPLLRSLGFEPGARSLAELGPPRKSKKLNRRGRTLKITTPLLVWGSCGIGRPFLDETRLRHYLAAGETTKLRRRLEADAKALVAYYNFGRLHHWVRLRWGFLDEVIPAPWVHRDESGLYELECEALESGRGLEVVSGSAPGWDNPWARARLCHVVSDGTPYGRRLVDGDGFPVDDREVQLARIPPAPPAE